MQQHRLHRKINEALVSFNADLKKSNYRPEPVETLFLAGFRVLGAVLSSAVMEGIGAYGNKQKPAYETTPYLGSFNFQDGRQQIIHGLLIGALP